MYYSKLVEYTIHCILYKYQMYMESLKNIIDKNQGNYNNIVDIFTYDDNAISDHYKIANDFNDFF